MTTEASTPNRRRAAFGFIFASALLNAVSFGITIPILPGLIKEFAGGDTAAAAEWNIEPMSVTDAVLHFPMSLLNAAAE